MINENCRPPNYGHVAHIKKPPTSFNTVDYMLYKRTMQNRKINLNTAPGDETGRLFFN